MEQPQYPGNVEQEWLTAILAVTSDAMVIEAVRDRQIAMARTDDDSTSE
jgi:hypothetical protein